MEKRVTTDLMSNPHKAKNKEEVSLNQKRIFEVNLEFSIMQKIPL
jgi:hypothetical protein